MPPVPAALPSCFIPERFSRQKYISRQAQSLIQIVEYT
ncbi:hypothetical protein CSC12_1058 [Klebsiella michiganensis]|nr:hypothetical protein CSC12_1058 [Klebsiella michiganensis]